MTPPYLIDTHAHIYHRRFESDQTDMIHRARASGVDIIIMPAIDVPSIHKALDLSTQHEGLYTMSAIHPSDTKEATEADWDAVVALCDHPNVVAVGESGLDYYWDRSFDEIQYDFFRRHIHLAIEKDLPLILHNREASTDLVRILTEEKARSDKPEQLRGIFHCFGGPQELAEDAIQLGFMLGIGGTVTFKNSGVADAIREVPLEHIVLETDAPFLAPVPYRGKRNEPSYVPRIAQRLAEIKGMSVADIARITTSNAIRLFQLNSSLHQEPEITG